MPEFKLTYDDKIGIVKEMQTGVSGIQKENNPSYAAEVVQIALGEVQNNALNRKVPDYNTAISEHTDQVISLQKDINDFVIGACCAVAGLQVETAEKEIEEAKKILVELGKDYCKDRDKKDIIL